MLVRGQGCDSFAQVVPKTVRLLFGIPRRGVQIKVFHLSDEKGESEHAPQMNGRPLTFRCSKYSVSLRETRIPQNACSNVYILTSTYPTRLYAKWTSSPHVMMKYFLRTSRFSSFSMKAIIMLHKHGWRFDATRANFDQLTDAHHPKTRYSSYISDKAPPMKFSHKTHR